MERLIVGVDPGITSAYAALDFEGNVVKLKSAKNFTLAMMLEELVAAGKPIVIGVDVKITPDFVKKLAAKLNAAIIHPQFDLPIGHKTRIVAEHKVKAHDDHQRDSLAAAFYAYAEVRPLLMKVEATLKKQGKEHLREKVQEMTLRGMNIVDAVNMLEEKPEITKPKKRIRDKIKRQNFLLEENVHLKRELTDAQHTIASLTGQLKNLRTNRENTVEQRNAQLLTNKDKTIHAIENKIKTAEQCISQLQQSLNELTRFFQSASHKQIAKKVPTLSQEAIDTITLNDQDILLVDDPNTFSKTALEKIKKYNLTLIARKKPSPSLEQEGIVILNANNLHLEEIPQFALIIPEELKREKEKGTVLFKIIQDYQEKRKQT